MQEEEKRHLLMRDQVLDQEERLLHNTLAHTNKSLDENKAQKAQIANILRQVEEELHRLHVLIKAKR